MAGIKERRKKALLKMTVKKRGNSGSIQGGGLGCKKSMS